ncbi:MAG: DUF1302 domain-containing protein [Proteobacteria bacterium]|nr:DUF1302 domain-containing protein [Pseudomonadota bacterium]
MGNASGDTNYFRRTDRRSAECKNRRLGTAIISLLAILFASPVGAINFTLGEDVKVIWNTTISLGTAWRTRDADARLIGADNANQIPGAKSQDNTVDDGNLNFRKKGDTFSTPLKIVSDMEIKRENLGGVIRVMGWKDFTLSDKSVPGGHGPTGYQSGARLDDGGFFKENKFVGVALQDFYGYGNFSSAGGDKINLRVGKQVVNWGESLFIQGINSYGTANVAAVRRPGAEVKDILLPYNQLFGSFGIAGGPTIEGWYQLKWQRTTIDPCGTFFSFADFGFDPSCQRLNMIGTDAAAYASVSGSPFAVPPFGPTSVVRGADITPGNGGQFGLSLRYRAESLDTDLGAYYTKYHARVPYVGFTMPTPGVVMGAPTAGVPLPFTPSGFNPQVIVSFPEDIKSFGVSAATLVGLWSVAGEINHTWDFPVQINGKDSLFAVWYQSFGQMLGVPPPGLMVPTAAALAPGGLMNGYDRIGKTQIQVNFIRVFNDILAANTLTFVGEGAYIHTNGMADVSQRRYGRTGVVGLATDGTPMPCLLFNTISDGCSTEGFVTKNSWGYRLLGELSYTGVIPGATLAPRLFWSHDVSGYSPDGTFIKDRKQLGLALKVDFQKKYFGEISYTTNDHSALYDALRDRDFVAVNVGMSF